jgi:catechol 2,3-dioxygenase-like lactoylglutathione lyase family enzyme
LKLPPVRIVHSAVKVSSVAQSSQFFQDVLGVKPAWTQADWGMIKSEGSTLALIEANTEAHPPHIGFVVDRKEDVDVFFDHFKKMGVKDLSDPKDHRDQSRSFYFKDNDGNQFELLWIPEHLTR